MNALPKKPSACPSKYVRRKLNKNGIQHDYVVKRMASCFGYDGFKFSQLDRIGNVALFAKTKPGWNFEIYEVVIVQVRDASEWPPGYLNPPHEAMPSPAQWGVCGWSYSHKDSARRKFDQLAGKHEITN